MCEFPETVRLGDGPRGGKGLCFEGGIAEQVRLPSTTAPQGSAFAGGAKALPWGLVWWGARLELCRGHRVSAEVGGRGRAPWRGARGGSPSMCGRHMENVRP